MATRFTGRGALALALLASPIAHAASDADLDEIRAQIRELKQGYESRIQALEQRLREAESRTQSTAPPATAAAATTPAAATTGASSQSAFNPAISAVLQGRYANLSRDPASFALAGFAPGGEESGPGRRGFSLGESELMFSANVDHKFAGMLTLALTPENSVAVEEAYGQFTAAPYGLAPKFGRFFSGLGYLNEQHQHAWDFVDAPLAYQAFLGGQYSNDGLQLKWIAPLDHYVEFGAEAGNGDNFPGGPRNKNGIGSGAAYVHTGGDIGNSHSWRAGLSYLRTQTSGRDYDIVNFEGYSLPVTFAGKSRVAIADLVWKWAPNGNSRTTNFKLQGEYFRREERGDFTFVRNADPVTNAVNTAPGYSTRQSGWYAQAVYQFMPQWRVGARFDALDQGTVDFGRASPYLPLADFSPKRTSVMLDYSPSEFSRLRLQLAQAKTQPGMTDNQWFLQYILSLGAHGAHKY